MLRQILCATALLCLLSNVIAQSTIAPASSNVCFGKVDADTLGLKDNIKPVRRWEMSVTGDQPWAIIANQTEKMTYSNLKTTTWFRAVVQNDGEVEQYSDVAVVNVLPEAVSGIISGVSNVCSGSNNGTLALSGQKGTVVKWQQFLSGGFWTDISGSVGKLAQPYTNINKDTWYRVFVQNGTGCQPVKTDSFKLSIDLPTNAGMLTGSNTVCKGSNSGEVSLTGNVGNIDRWEWSSTGLSPWSSIIASGTTLNYTNLSNTTFYRAIVRSGTCAENASLPIAVVVNDPSLGGLTYGTTAVCSSFNSGEVALTGSLGGIVQWQYSITDGVSWRDTAITISKINYTNLTHSTIYQAQIKNGICPVALSTQTKITVYPLPLVSFAAPSQTQGTPVNFSNSSSISVGTLKQFLWDFGDGNNATAKNPAHIFDNSGSYKIKLEVTSDKGCVDSLSQNLDIHEVPKVDFAFSNICAKKVASFLNTSVVTYPSPTYSWDFGDGSQVSALSSPLHKYTLSGMYQVTLTITTPYAVVSKTKAIQVYDQASPDFVVSNVCLGNNVQILNKSSIKSGYLTYIWDFGDSNSSADLNPMHTYDLPGNYTIRLVTTSNFACGDTIYKNIAVNPVPFVKFSATNVSFGNLNQFIDSSTIISGKFKESWAFGDGITSNVNNPSHIYASSGNYLATLTVKSDSGCVAMLSKTVWVYPKPHAAFTAQSVCVYDSVSFGNQSTISAGALHFSWQFGDGQTSILKNPVWKYNFPGIYQVKMIAISDNDGQDTVIKAIEIFPKPIVVFQDQNVCDGKPVVFQNTSTIITGSLVSYLWDFGDGSNAIQQSPAKQYLNPGTYHVSLAVMSDKNCKELQTHDVTVNENPVANFSIASVCLKQQVMPVNLSTSRNLASYEWIMGDGKFYAVFAPSHVYGHEGLFDVKLIVTDENGCTDSLSRSVVIYGSPLVNAGNDTSVVLGFPVQLHATGGAIYEWYPAEGLSSAIVQDPIAKPTSTTTYFVTTQDQYGCINRDSMVITVNNDYVLIATNVLTPDGNGKNDTWYVQNIENYPEALVTVFNRWGAIVMQTKNYQNNWNGTNSNKDLLPDGAYFYVITIPGAKTIYKGTVTILRNK